MFLKKKFLVWIVISLFYAYQYVLRVIPAISLNEITTRFSIDAAQFGTFCGIYYIGYTAASIPLSIAIDRFNTKKVIVGTILLVVIGMLPLISNNWYLAVIGRLASGIGSAGAILSLFKIIATYFNQRESSKMLGISVTIGLLGAIYGGKPLAHLMNSVGFVESIEILIMIGIAMAIVTFVLLPTTFSGEANTQVSVKDILIDVKSIFSNKSLMYLAVAGGLMVGGLEGFADGWSSVTFEFIHGWNKLSAASAPSMIFLGMCIGASVIGYITEKSQKYYTIIVTSSIIMIACFTYILYGNGEYETLMLSVLFMIGFASAYQIVLMTKAGILSGNKLVTTGTAIANMIVMIFGTIYHSIIGNIVSATNTLSDGAFSAESLSYGITPILFGLLVAIPFLFMSAKNK